MATPHVAGAAALLAAAHPDWTGPQLKDALVSSTKATPSYTPYQAGSGRLDALAAVHASVFATASAYSGFHAWPTKPAETDVQKVTYTNAGDAPVSLDLALNAAVLLDAAVTSVERDADGVAVTVTCPDGDHVVRAATLLVCVGRRPNTDPLDGAAGGLELDEHGHIVTDSAYRTSVPGVWALGDVVNHFQLKHMANAESRLVRHNVLHPQDVRTLTNKVAPHAVFTSPQIASVGLTEQEARRRKIEYLVSTRDYAETAYGWALEDTTSFVKVLANPLDRTNLGAHIIGPQAATLIQPLIQAMTLGLTVDRIARDVLYIHPALTEAVEQALLAL